MARHRVIAPDDPNFPAIRRRLIETTVKTILGYLAMGALIVGALALTGFTYKFQLNFSLLWIVLPVPMWWFSAKIALAITKSKPADPSNPDHKRLIDIVDRVYAKSGLKFKPPVYVSDNPLPNAFATGPIHRKAVVAATRGLFDIGATDAEIEAIFAHELGHVKNYDVGINSGLAVLSSIFFLIADAGVRVILGGFNLLRGLFGAQPLKLSEKGPNRGFIAGILNWVLFYAIFWLTGQITRVVQLFVVRSRESAADATASIIHGKPCDLATALQKLVAYVEKNRPKGRDESLIRAFRPIMTIDPIYDARVVEPKGGGIWEALKRFWKRLQLTHPPVPERIEALDKMAGGKCPRI